MTAPNPCNWSGTRCYMLGLVAPDPCGGVWVWQELDSTLFGFGVSQTQQSLELGHCQTYQLLGLDLTRLNNTWVCLVSHLARLHKDMFDNGTCYPKAPKNAGKIYPYIFLDPTFFRKHI